MTFRLAMSTDTQQLHAIVRGQVQGVNFRSSTQAQARRLGLLGWVRNRPEGTVEVVAPWAHPFGVANQENAKHGPLANYRTAGLADMAAAHMEGREHRCSLERTLHGVEVMTSCIISGQTGQFITMTTTNKRILSALPALFLVAVAAVLTISSLSGTSLASVKELPRRADVQSVTPDGLSPATTTRDWVEVDGTRTRGGFR